MTFGSVPGHHWVFRRRDVVIPVGGRLPYVDADWADALVVVERGEVDLCCSLGGVRRFGPGSVLFLVGLGLVSLHNPGVEETVLVGHSREDVENGTDRSDLPANGPRHET